MNQLTELLLALFILNLGTAFGAGLYETRIVLPLWFLRSPDLTYRVNTEAMHTIETGRTFWGFVTTGPLTLLTLANIFAAWQSPDPVHDWWLSAALLTLAERTGTFAFFIPTAIKLQKAGQLPAASVSRLVTSWVRLNYLRNALTLIAWLLALKALTIGR
ncbi:anthrone oxygenase family protein [uncultured Fibrella sp.]|uniref:anthrone oxygenase family protein n=1 Tax=uncultured Fibrella sp. TaxID=1284596 RepID=UPI0035CA11CB